MARERKVATVQAALDLGDDNTQMVLALEAVEDRRPEPPQPPKVSREKAMEGWKVLRRVLGKTVH